MIKWRSHQVPPKKSVKTLRKVTRGSNYSKLTFLQVVFVVESTIFVLIFVYCTQTYINYTNAHAQALHSARLSNTHFSIFFLGVHCPMYLYALCIHVQCTQSV